MHDHDQAPRLIECGFAMMAYLYLFPRIFERRQQLFRLALMCPNNKNRALLPVVDHFTSLADAGVMGTIKDTIDKQMDIVDAFLECCLSIGKHSPSWRWKLLYRLMKTLLAFIAGQPLAQRPLLCC
jgi:hypothetical protein